MRQIGFKNFRKFVDFPKIDLSPITIFVGENNAGKSTVVKGVLALADFLDSFVSIDYDRPDPHGSNADENTQRISESLKNLKFYFNTSYLAHIGTFKRAICNKAPSDTIEFSTRLGVMDYVIEVVGDKKDEDSVYGVITRIICVDNRFNFTYDFDLMKDKAEITFNPVCDDVIKEYTRERYENQFAYLIKIKETRKVSFQLSAVWSLRFYRINLLSSLLESVNTFVNILTIREAEDDNTIERGLFPSNVMEKLKILKASMSQADIEYVRSLFSVTGQREAGERPFIVRPALYGTDIEYIYAHAVSQTVIYSAKDTNDYLSRTIHEFASNKITHDKKEFIIYWMKEFSIGKDFEIRSIGGEAHLVKIVNFDGEKVNLADKGMGSIQLMVLLFRLAIKLPSSKTRGRKIMRRPMFMGESVLIIEEPEQNLHPMLQSKLADLFFSLNEEYGFRFIVETHSEYLIRRSQVIVGSKFNTPEDLEKNPFKVFYFPADGVPYDMVYTTTGMFENKFGDGFINEASKLHMEILKNSKRK